jgi:hypothetical protein
MQADAPRPWGSGRPLGNFHELVLRRQRAPQALVQLHIGNNGGEVGQGLFDDAVFNGCDALDLPAAATPRF